MKTKTMTKTFREHAQRNPRDLWPLRRLVWESYIAWGTNDHGVSSFCISDQGKDGGQSIGEDQPQYQSGSAQLSSSHLASFRGPPDHYLTWAAIIMNNFVNSILTTINASFDKPVKCVESRLVSNSLILFKHWSLYSVQFFPCFLVPVLLDPM